LKFINKRWLSYKIYLTELLDLTGGYKKKLPHFLFLFLFLSIIDVVGIGLIMPYVSLITSPELFFNNFSNLDFLLGGGKSHENINNVIVIIGLMLISLFAFKAFLAIRINRKILTFCYFRGSELRSCLMKSYQTLPYDEFVRKNSATYIYNIQTITMMYSKGILQSFLRLVSEFIVFVAIIIVLAFSDINALLLLISILLVSYYLYSYLYSKRIRKIGKLVNKYNNKSIRYISEGVKGMKEIRILGKESFFHDKIASYSDKYADVSVENHVIQTIPRYAIEFIIMLFVVIMVMFQIFSGESLSEIVPVLSMFGVASIRLTPSINQMISSISQMRYGSDALHTLHKDYKSFKFRSNLLDLNKISKSAANESNALKLKDISYTYKGSIKPALQGINLSILKGECVGIVGGSGAGKTTLIDIILGLLKPSIGKITLNIDNIAYLPQEVFIIDDSVRKNIILSDDSACSSRLTQSIDQAKMSVVVDTMPLGVETVLGEGGSLLSGGQRQRISLARAFYHDADLLVMDESTSALDEATEIEVSSEISQLKGEKTIIIVSHRKALLKDCDYVYDLDKKEVIK
jgi:ATP-binding cassette, subfamily B, bacterial PglK